MSTVNGDNVIPRPKSKFVEMITKMASMKRRKRPKVEKYPAARLRAIRLKQVLDTIEGHTHYNDGMPIDKSKLIDLHQ